MAKVKVEVNASGKGKVFIDGKQQREVVGIRINAQAMEMTKISIDYHGREVEFEGEADVIAVINGRKYKLVEGG